MARKQAQHVRHYMNGKQTVVNRGNIKPGQRKDEWGRPVPKKMSAPNIVARAAYPTKRDTKFKLGQVVHVKSDNSNYKDFMDKPLIIIHIATNTHEHPGFDYLAAGKGGALYDLKTKDGKNVPFSLYDWELE